MKKNNMKSLYDVLGISQNATNDTIRSAYLQKAKESHPDKMNNNDKRYFDKSNQSNESSFIDIKAAYDVLSNPQKRFIYDNQFDAQFGAFFSSNTFNTDDTSEDLSFADISDIYDKFMSFVTIASHIINKRKGVGDHVDNINEEKEESNPSAPIRGEYTSTSNIGPIAPINVQVKASLRDFYYGRVKTVMVTISKIDLQTETETFDVPLDIDEKIIEFRERGDEYLSYRDDGSSTIARGSVVINIDVEEDPEIQHYTLFTNHDLMVEISINLYDYIFGKSFSIFIFDEKVKIRYQGGKPTTMIVENKGLPLSDKEINRNRNVKRGRCFVCLDLSLPVTFDTLHVIRSSPNDPLHNEMKMFKILCRKYLSSKV